MKIFEIPSKELYSRLNEWYNYFYDVRALERGNLLLQLRALYGVNVRAEIIAYLLTHEAAHPAEIARASYYHNSESDLLKANHNIVGYLNEKD